MADKTTKELERIYTIPLREVKSSPRNHRTDRAVRAVKNYLSRHMKSQEIWIDGSVNEKLWERGMYKIPSKIRVRALKFDDGVVEVTLPEIDITTSRRAEMAKAREEREAAKEKKAADKAKAEEPAAEEKPAAEAKPATGETPKGETPKADSPKPDAPKAEKPKPETPKADKPKPDASEKKAAAPESKKPAAEAKKPSAKSEAPSGAAKPAPKKE
jgi:large subunit ribosomal protein L31e